MGTVNGHSYNGQQNALFVILVGHTIYSILIDYKYTDSRNNFFYETHQIVVHTIRSGATRSTDLLIFVPMHNDDDNNRM